MNSTLKLMINMKAALWVNGFIFYFKKLWIVGKWMPESVYSNYSTKKVLTVIALVIRQILDFLTKPFYLFIAAIVPMLLILQRQPQFVNQQFSVVVHTLFFLSCCTGAFGDSYIFAVSRDKITCMKYMNINVRSYIKSSLVFRYVPFFLYFLIWIVIIGLVAKWPIGKVVCAWLMLLCFRMTAEAFHLFVFDKTEKVLSRNMVFEWILIIVGLAGAYLLPYNGWILPATILLHPLAALCYMVLSIVSIYYITIGYKGYEKKYTRSLDQNFLMSSMLKTSSGASFKEVEMKETDLDLTETSQGRYQHLHGYTYLNALFFARHKRQLLRPVYYRLMIVAAVFAGGLFFYRVNPKLAVLLSQNMTASLLPSFVFIMYAMTIADKACRAMFYNCDKDMLRYAYYRSPQTILKTFQVRLFRISLLNMTSAAAICLAAMAFCFICGTSIFTLDLLLLCITVLLLSVLFTAHHLCLYYIFQPYSQNLQVKNPFFTGINAIMYMLCFLCLRLKVGGIVFTAAVLAFTVIYILTALALVYHRAPKSFRVK